MAWPFTKKSQTDSRYPTVSIGAIRADWSVNDGWTFVDPILGVDWATCENDEFHESIVTKLPIATGWITTLSDEILGRVNEYAINSSLPVNVQHIQGIDASRLGDSDQVDICYTAEEWGGFAINVVVTGGEITDVYGGD